LNDLEKAIEVWVDEQKSKGDLEKSEVDYQDSHYSDLAADKWEEEPSCEYCGSTCMIYDNLCEDCIQKEEEEEED